MAVPLKDPYSDMLQKQTDWQNANRVGTGLGGGIDLISYTELHHPMSHHNVATGHDHLKNTFPTDLENARKKAELVQKGYYAKEALVLDNAYPKKVSGRVLRPLDPRLEKNNSMLGWPNETVTVNENLMSEIEKATRMRAYQRGLADEPPSPEKLNNYSQQAAQIVEAELKKVEEEKLARLEARRQEVA